MCVLCLYVCLFLCVCVHVRVCGCVGVCGCVCGCGFLLTDVLFTYIQQISGSVKLRRETELVRNKIFMHYAMEWLWQ